MDLKKLSYFVIGFVLSLVFGGPVFASSSGITFLTNLDEPQKLIVSRDSLNYRLSDSILRAVTEINSQRSFDEQIQVLTFGGEFSQNTLQHIVKEAQRNQQSVLPRTPLKNIMSDFQKNQRSWWRHLEMDVDFWLQDLIEFYYEDESLKVFSFRHVVDPQSFLSEKEQSRLAQLEELLDKKPVRNSQRIFDEVQKILNSTKDQVSAIEKDFFKAVQIQGQTQLKKINAEGGDFEILPHNVIFTSIAPKDGLTTIKQWLSKSVYADRIISVDADWLEVGHVDELVSVVPADNPCGFALMVMSPELGVNIVKSSDYQQPLSSLIPEEYHKTQPLGGGLLEGVLPSLYQTLSDKTMPSRSRVNESLLALQLKVQARVNQSVSDLKAKYLQMNPQCQDIPTIPLPVLVNCKSGTKKLKGCKTLLPNPVNSIVLGKDLLVPDPFVPELRQEITSRLSANGLKAHFVDSGYYHILQGEAHCATNVIRKRQSSSSSLLR